MESEKKKSEKEREECPVKGTSYLSQMTFAWTMKIFNRGAKKVFTAEDLYQPLRSHKSERLGSKLYSAWNNEVERCKGHQNRSPSLIRAGLKVFWWQITLIAIVEFIEEFFVRLIQPIFLAALITDFSKDLTGTNIREAYLYAGGIVLCSLVQVFMKHPCFFYQTHIGMQMRVASSSMVYRKVLKLTKNALERSSIGQVVNLLSNDVSRFEFAVTYIHYLWIGPLMVIAISVILYYEIGISVFFGVSFMVLFVPLQMFLGKLNSKLRLRTAIRTDKRVRLMNEIIQGIQVIKQYTWEYAFAKLVEDARKSEMHVIRQVSYIRGILMSFILFTTRTSIFLSLVGYVLLGNFLDARKAFLVTAYFNILRLPMTSFFAQGLNKHAETMISAKRIEKFMLLAEVDEEQQVSSDTTTCNIQISQACSKWDSSQQEYTLQDVSLSLQGGSLNAVVGYVGASKSSFLQLILKELPIESGTVNVSGSISYASQEPFLFSGSIRQNILFGQPFDAERYRTVTRICALDQDFRLLPHKDNTIIGERGTTLSGGQKARVNLARAIYREANIYLLDDPLSAVDPHVSKHLFDKCIRKFLHGKLVILVTNQLEYLEKVDKVIYLEHGKVKALGTYEELLKMGLDFTKLMEKEDEEEVRERERSRTHSESVSYKRKSSIDSSVGDECEDSNKCEDPDLMEVDEKQEKGAIGANVYRKYFRAAGGFCCIVCVALICVSSQMFASGADYYWSVWVAKQKALSENQQNASYYYQTDNLDFWTSIIEDPYFDVYLFSSITVCTIITTFWRSFALVNACVRASKTLHNAMFEKITKAQMYFFNINPSGRILNRFSKDMGQIDELLPSIWIDLIQHFLTIFGVIFVTSLVNPFFLIPIIMIATLFYYLRIYYLKTSSSLKRLEATTRSPIFTHLSASLNGLSTIRAFQAESILISEFDSLQDTHSSAFYLFIATNRAFGCCLDFICVFYIAAVTFSFFWMSATGGNIGLAITQAINFRVQFAVRQSAELENNMTAVERVLEYDDIKVEELQSKTENRPKRTWPEEGHITYNKLSLKYFDNQLAEKVLMDVTFDVKGNEKIGIVGRTGSGKSSLISALFRLFYNDGLISIDSVNTADIGLHDLRSKISIIPQEPVLFSGTIRYNLDPFENYTDAKLWTVLEEVQLKEAVQELASGLLSYISEGGSNFSVGQRQLICLARAILRDNKILVMDEATANVDSNTDALIQKTIRTKFANCTVLTIAHRLNTIMDSDKIIVMNEGRCIEFGPPYELLTATEGPRVFQTMAKQTGDVYFENYLNVAKRSSKKLN